MRIVNLLKQEKRSIPYENEILPQKRKLLKQILNYQVQNPICYKKKERRIEQANNSSIKFENRLKNLGVN